MYDQFHGEMKIEYLNGKEQKVNVKQLHYNAQAVPTMIEDFDGVFYNWSAVLSVTSVKTFSGVHKITITCKVVTCTCGWNVTQATEHWANRSAQEHFQTFAPFSMMPVSNYINNVVDL